MPFVNHPSLNTKIKANRIWRREWSLIILSKDIHFPKRKLIKTGQYITLVGSIYVFRTIKVIRLPLYIIHIG